MSFDELHALVARVMHEHAVAGDELPRELLPKFFFRLRRELEDRGALAADVHIAAGRLVWYFLYGEDPDLRDDWDRERLAEAAADGFGVLVEAAPDGVIAVTPHTYH